MTIFQRTRTRLTAEAGSMAVEVVVLAPVLIAVMLLVVGFGRYVDRRGDVEALARDAVRAASFQRDEGSALVAAQQITGGVALPDGVSCSAPALSGAFAAGQTITITLQCQVSYAGLGFAGLPGSATITGSSSAPLDTLRRTGP